MRILKISKKNFKEVVKISTKAVKEGKIVVCPTDTVYGLIANATNKKAVEKIFKIKRRQKEKAIPIFIKDLKMAKKLARIDRRQEEFLKKIWPGKITIIFKSKKPKMRVYGINKGTIGLRMPDYKTANLLLQKLNFPLTGTSANISGKSPSGNIKKILSQFQNKEHQPDLVIDAGNLPKRKPSTVLGLTTSPPKILRI